MLKIEKLDHGVLSMPNRTRNINSDIDKYKVEKAKQDKRDLEDRLFLNIEAEKSAKNIYESLEKKHFSLYAKKAGISLSEARTELKAMCVSHTKAIKVFNALIDLAKKEESCN